MKLRMILATIMLTAVPPTFAKGRQSTGVGTSSCLSRTYDIEKKFRCGGDEFIAPDFTVSPSLCRGEVVGVAIMSFRNGGGSGNHVLAKKIAFSCTGKPYTKWADSRRCSQLNEVQHSREYFDLPRRMLHTDRDAVELDGSTYKMELSGFYPKDHAAVGVTLTGNDVSPVGKWVSGALKALQPCWADKRPAR